MKGINVYLTFDGACRDAMQFYKECLGGELHIAPFSDAPHEFPPEQRNHVMHAALNWGPHVLMASDAMPGGPVQNGNNYSVCIQCESLDEIERFFAALSAGGTAAMPLQDTFWGARFGMLRDRFGIQWMLNFEKPKQG
ncbi:MAG TPA: VOC family protein [Terriglobia bacterium]|nr:VOC family protein [Terriglobia bacterium]